MLYLAYDVGDGLPRRVGVQGLHAPVHVDWQDDARVAYIEADSLLGAYAALGYVHGARRTWTAVLWRQTALGRLAEWYGEVLLPLDRFTRRLGFAALARETYATLPEADRALLEAYARGMNAALQTDAVQMSEFLVLLEEHPAPWQPWHTHAVERLFAWLSTPPPAPERLAATDSSVAAFLSLDAALHRWLALHGFAHSVAFVVRDSAAAHLFQRHVYGASALPVYQAVVLDTPQRPPLLGASLPGTPFFPAGRTGTHAWAVLPSSTMTLERVAYDSTRVTRSFTRLLDADGIEHLLTIRRLGDALPLGRPTSYPRSDTTRADTALARPLPPPPADSIWQVQWPGLTPGTDLAAWQALVRGAAPTFHLLEGDGLRMDSTGSVQVMGTPQVVERFPAGLVVGNTFWVQYAADELRVLASPDSLTALSEWIDVDSSAWAAQTAPVLLASLDSLARSRGGRLTTERSTGIFHEALTYLINWNFSYDRASIGASIYDTWTDAYALGRRERPKAPAADTASGERLRRYQALQQAVSSLARTFGRDLRRWRWEHVMPDVRYFPGWPADTLLGRAPHPLTRTRYAPIRLPGRGHPSALSWGPSLLHDGRPAPAAWETWISTAAWDRLFVRRRRFDLEAFLGRYRIPDRRPPPVVLTPDANADRSTLLVPAERQ